MAAAIEALDHATVARLSSGETVEVAGVDIGPDDVLVRRRSRPGRIVLAEGPLCVALDAEPDGALLAEGRAREVVSRVQAIRRGLDLAVTDRIELGWDTGDEALAAAIEQHAAFIAAEVLATSVTRGGEGGDPAEVDGVPLTLTVTRVG